MDSASIKKQNMDLVRRLLWQSQPYTKLEISKKTGLSVATCNTLLNELQTKGEVLGERAQIKDVGRTSVVYRYNEKFESYLCINYQLIGGVKTARVLVFSPVGTTLDCFEENFQILDYTAIENMVARILEKYPNTTQILVGTPSIAEKGVVRHCDVKEMEGVPLVNLLEKRFQLPVHMENDIHYKAYGYYKKKENPMVLLRFAFSRPIFYREQPLFIMKQF